MTDTLIERLADELAEAADRIATLTAELQELRLVLITSHGETQTALEGKATITAENKRLRGAYATIMELNPEDYVCGEAILLRGIQVTIRAALKGQS